MHEILGYSISEWLGIITIISMTFGGCLMLINYFKRSISEPITKALEELKEDLQESRESHRQNESKLFNIADDHTKKIYDHEGRLKSIEAVTFHKNEI